MVDKNEIRKLVEGYVAGKDIFLVDIKVSSSNRITVLVNRKAGLTIDDCVALSRHIEGSLDREKEDFELQVSSPGLDMPLAVVEQYEMNLGRKVEVINQQGTAFTGILREVSGSGFLLEYEKKELGKKKELVSQSFSFSDTRSVKVLISFK